ncbi:hypothetical protein MHK_001084 [Candidatus Magnetomorum sp. HK-1]|nr:hypothetical protein MHK_001084 [Candidatus Magnetomorum sp. HK-1]
MKDKLGIYYYPFADNKQVRMYVRESKDTIEFRLWKNNEPDLWENHGWLPHEAIQAAIKMYDPKKGGGFDPSYAYDLNLAKNVLRDKLNDK